MRIIACGIDPGRHGACAIVEFSLSTMKVALFPMPWTATGLDARKLQLLLENNVPSSCLVVCEELAPFCHVGSRKSIFGMGVNFGATIAAIRCAGISPELVKPKVWQSFVFPKKGTNKDKQKTWAAALSIGIPKDWMPNDGYADAFLIACSIVLRRKTHSLEQLKQSTKERWS